MTSPVSSGPAAPAATVRAARADDADALARIYNHYVAHSVATFEETPVTPDDMAHRLTSIREARLPWLVAESGGVVVGYAYAAPWKQRAAYRFSVEITVYLSPDHAGRGIGTALYTELFRQLRATGVHAVMGGIALPNDASIALHERFGMRRVAEFREVGFKFGRWVDVAYWQVVL